MLRKHIGIALTLITLLCGKKIHSMQKHKCGVFPQCTATSLRERIITPSGDMQTLFSEQLNVPKPVVCEMHYQHLYRILHMQNPCAGCGAKPKSRQGVYTRHSPNAEKVSQYLCDRTGFNGEIALRKLFFIFYINMSIHY